MAFYKYSDYLSRTNNEVYDAERNPGTMTPLSGIYRCTGCGHEIVSEQYKPFPSQNHHQHPSTYTPIRWKLIVYADHNPK